MDHLPPPIDHSTHDKVHFYAPLSKHEVYHPQDFFTIPSEYGYKDFQELLENGLNDSMTTDDANGFLQSWLWFSLLAQVLDIDVDQTHFYRYSDTLCTSRLNAYLFEWITRAKKAAENADGHHHKQTSSYVRASIALITARRFISRHCAHNSMDRDDRSRVPFGIVCPYAGCTVDKRVDVKMALSLAILGETLQHERPPMPPGLEGCSRFCNEPETQEKSWGHSTYCRNMLQGNGWCPFEIRRMEATLSGVSNVYLVCKMKPPNPNVDHSCCTSWGCTASKPTQLALHMQGCVGVNCTTNELDERWMVKCIRDGQTPLVTWTQARGMQHTAKNLEKDKDVVFVALTHCWEDGLVESGRDARNRNNRAMHECQLERIQDTCSRLFKGKKGASGWTNIFLWIDVLCLPRDPDIRASAVNQMKTIYSRAKTVLVWDRHLIEAPKDSSAIVMNMRVRMSNWTQRLWTLQEAVLASDLHVQFKDGTVSIKEMEKAGAKARNDIDNDYHHVWKAGHPFSTAIWKLRQPRMDCRVQRAWEAVQFRLVTKPQDEAIIIANVLKLNVKELEDIGHLLEGNNLIATQRMVKLLQMLDQQPDLGIPSGIIFLPPPKLAIDGYGWAPSTWLSKQAHAYPLTRPQRLAGSMMKEGFLVEFPGLILHCPDVSNEEAKFWVPVQQSLNTWFKIMADKGNKGKDFKEFWENHVPKNRELSIIMSTENPQERWEVGVLVQTKGLLTRGEVRWVRILCRVWVRLEMNTNIIRDLSNSFRERGDTMIFGERLNSQKWCIDGGNA